MSRPQKVHKPIKGGFNNILASVAAGSGKGKQTADRLAKQPTKPPEPPKAERR